MQTTCRLPFQDVSGHRRGVIQTSHSPARKLAMLLIGLLIIRVIALFIAPWGLHGDEAQYWAWSQDLDFGYFSKPPMIAWVIAATTSIFGQAEWAVRLSAPFLHIATSVMIFLAARRFFDAQVGFWATATYTLMPAVWLSSFIMSTDAALLLCWAIALHAWACLRENGRWGRVIQLGLALGFGLLSKYAMAFMVPVLGLAVLLDLPTRRALLGPRGFVGAAIAAALLMPNLMWNAAHDFATISHTAENANLGRDLFNPEEVFQFWGDQFGVFGIVPFALLLIALVAAFRGTLPKPIRWLAALCALPLAAITVEALLSRANANWAVTAYVAGPILVAVWATRSPRRLAWLKWGLIAQTAVCLFVGGVAASERSVDAVGLTNAVKRLRAWPETSAQIEARLMADAYAYVATDNRLVFYDLNYYRVTNEMLETTELVMWSLNDAPAHHANLTRALPDTDAPILLLSYHHNFEEYFRADFETLEELPPITVGLGTGKTRVLKVWRGTGYRKTSLNDRT